VSNGGKNRGKGRVSIEKKGLCDPHGKVKTKSRCSRKKINGPGSRNVEGESWNLGGKSYSTLQKSGTWQCVRRCAVAEGAVRREGGGETGQLMAGGKDA